MSIKIESTTEKKIQHSNVNQQMSFLFVWYSINSRAFLCLFFVPFHFFSPSYSSVSFAPHLPSSYMYKCVWEKYEENKNEKSNAKREFQNREQQKEKQKKNIESSSCHMGTVALLLLFFCCTKTVFVKFIFEQAFAVRTHMKVCSVCTLSIHVMYTTMPNNNNFLMKMEKKNKRNDEQKIKK